ncbi:DUF2057 family protein [Halioxenophilus aromaticivorans]|uniref:DUF2057 family protein n=1 Tax=Halioxenophilus aromaticivorans TaxID=1306992 RepID=UPI0036F1C7BB
MPDELPNARYSTATLQAGQRYQINYRRPNTKEQARAWKDTPEIWLDTALIQNTGTNRSNDSDAVVNTTETTDNQSIAAAPTKIVAEPLPEEPNPIERLLNSGSTGPKPGDNADNPVLTGLKFYWQQASEAEREQFLIWVSQQP